MDSKVDILLLAGKGTGLTLRNKENDYSTCVDWLVDSFKQDWVSSIRILGGRDISNLESKYPNIEFIYNPDWMDTGPLYSLMLAEDFLCSSNTIIAYADVVYRKSLIQDFFINLDSNFCIMTDLDWKTRYPNRTKFSLDKAEKIRLDSQTNKVKKVGIDHITKISGEFAGLFYQSKETSISFFKEFKENNLKNEFRHHTIMDYFSFMLSHNHEIKSYNINGNWAELDETKSDGKHFIDFQHFVFGTKAHTLSRLKPIVTKGKILTQVAFTVDDWNNNYQRIVSKIQNHFSSEELVIRSSSLNEDSLESSLAGSFTSVLNVDKNNDKILCDSIRKVIKSYGPNVNVKDQVLVQPQLKNVTMSGVIFTCDIRTGSPYYTINFSKSGDTDLITGGQKGEYHLLNIYKSNVNQIKDKKINKLIECAKELEHLTGNELLDIEFAFDTKRLYIFQTRPIVSKNVVENYYKFDIDEKIKEIEKETKDFLTSNNNQKTILGDMPDWNPAELLGSKPRPLAISLFDELITKDIWRLARKDLGYHNPENERLLAILGGHPYINVRNSLYSLTPRDMEKKIRDKLVNESLMFLSNNYDAHDKFEFEVATTCFSPSIFDRVSRWKNFGFSSIEIDYVIETYKLHTQEILNNNYVKLLSKKIEILESRRTVLTTENEMPNSSKIKHLIDDCRVYGTRPFASLARLAFIGKTFLKSFLSKKIINQIEYESFLNSIETVATEMAVKLEEVKKNKISLDNYLNIYGHLRPGTWDIRSYTYLEKPELYFNFTDQDLDNHSSFENRDNSSIFSNKTMKDMQSVLDEIGLQISIENLLIFIEESIKAREYSKFIFSKNISEILSLINQMGKSFSLSRSDLSFIGFSFFFSDEKLNNNDLISKSLNTEKQIREKQYMINQQILTPQIISSPADFSIVKTFKNRPNYITSKKLIGKIQFVKKMHEAINLEGKIVFIESADPGYDWIFTHNILGIVTKYGGAASHMAIRASEFNLPSVIGLGPPFDSLRSSKRISLDCENRKVSSI